jgi:hypothetical protein
MRDQQDFEKYRVLKHLTLATDKTYGRNGYFKIEHPHVENYFINCIVSDGRGWEHVSVSLSSTRRNVERCPTWAEMCFVKNLFWGPEETVLQYHPPESQYVNCHQYTLHLWKPCDLSIPLPHKNFV